MLEPLTDPLPAARDASSSRWRDGAGSLLLVRSELAIRAKLRRLGSADVPTPAPAADRPRSLDEVVVQVDTLAVCRPQLSAAHQPAAPAPAAARVTSANRLCELATGGGGGGGGRTGLSATLPRAAPTPCFYVHPPAARPEPEPAGGGGAPVPRPPASSCGSSRPETAAGALVCGVPEAEMRGMGVAVCVLMLMMSGLAIVYGYFMGY